MMPGMPERATHNYVQAQLSDQLLQRSAQPELDQRSGRQVSDELVQVGVRPLQLAFRLRNGVEDRCSRIGLLLGQGELDTCCDQSGLGAVVQVVQDLPPR